MQNKYRAGETYYSIDSVHANLKTIYIEEVRPASGRMFEQYLLQVTHGNTHLSSNLVSKDYFKNQIAISKDKSTVEKALMLFKLRYGK